MKLVRILLVEDNEGDIVLTREALNEGKIKNEISIARDGEEALTFLKEATVLPDLVLLDINLPRMNGLELLTIIKQDDYLKKIPVIMLTTSVSEKDIFESYSNYANCFISKPVNLQQFMEVVKTIEDFWISIVRLPQKI